MDTSKFTFEVRINGRAITEYRHEGDVYVEGRDSSVYSLHVTNHTGKSAKLVLSVDGLSVIDGHPASENSQGYIVKPYGSIDVEGWRTSDDEVRVFKFGSRKKSYVAKTGNDVSNIGVIGLMFIPDKTFHDSYVLRQISDYWWPSDTMVKRGLIYPEITCNAVSYGSHNMGTEMGDAIQSAVQTVQFNPDLSNIETACFYYDDRKGLESRGIIVDARKLKPSPFPASSRYCKVI